jgi:UDPglucose--hexose-1-phosphate uridylyltransferase
MTTMVGAIPAHPGTRNLLAMSELRHDRLAGRAVIVAAGRAARPHQFTAAPDEERGGQCPFCPGNEGDTPPERHRTGHGAADGPGWRVRVFPNLYPIVGGADAGPGATGAHEVVALSPGHSISFAHLDDDGAAEVFCVLRDRVRAHLDAGHAFALAIINHRRAAGASIAHPHAQVLALDFVPPLVAAGIERFRDAGEDLVLADARAGTPLLDDATASLPPGVLAWSPHAAAAPGMVRLALEDAGASFAAATDKQVEVMGRAVRDVLARLSAWMHDPPYNLVLHTAPSSHVAFHWYIEITPRVSVVAGFEQGTGVLVNTIPPEVTAEFIRNAGPEAGPEAGPTGALR